MSKTLKVAGVKQDGTKDELKRADSTETSDKKKSPKKTKEKASEKITENQMTTLEMIKDSPNGFTTYKAIQEKLGIKKPHVCRLVVTSSKSLLNRDLVEVYLQEPDEFSIHPYYAIYLSPEGKLHLLSNI